MRLKIVNCIFQKCVIKIQDNMFYCFDCFVPQAINLTTTSDKCLFSLWPLSLKVLKKIILYKKKKYCLSFFFFCMILLFICFIFYPPLLYKSVSQDPFVMHFYGYFVFHVYTY